MRILVCGGRNYRDPDAVYSALDNLKRGQSGVSLVIEGGALGADCFAAEWADMTGTPHMQFAADWKRFGRAAGAIRNKQMLDEGKPDLVVAFPGGRGTANMIAQAEKAGVRVQRMER